MAQDSANRIVLDGNGAQSGLLIVSGIDRVNADVVASINNITITNGRATSSTSNNGGGLYISSGNVRALDNNLNIDCSAAVTVSLNNNLIKDSVASDDRTTGSAWGGGIYNGGGTLYMYDSTVKNNQVVLEANYDRARGLGGGIYNSADGKMEIYRSTIDGNLVDASKVSSIA